MDETLKTVGPEALPWPEEQALIPAWPTAGRALGCGRTQTFRLISTGKFPVEVLSYGNRFFVRTAELRAELGLPLTRPSSSEQARAPT
jgi:hypothetical protein